jgi:hypothetical protein
MCVLILDAGGHQRAAAAYYMCPHTTYVSSYYIRVLILHMCPHTTCASTYERFQEEARSLAPFSRKEKKKRMLREKWRLAGKPLTQQPFFLFPPVISFFYSFQTEFFSISFSFLSYESVEEEALARDAGKPLTQQPHALLSRRALCLLLLLLAPRRL